MTTTEPVPQDPRPQSRVRTALRGVRNRLVLSIALLLAFSTLGSVLLVQQILDARLDDRVEEAAAQEVSEFRRLVNGRNPRTGEPFGADVASIFDVFLSRNVPSEGEAFLTFVDGRAYKTSRSARGSPAPLERNDSLMRRWARLARTERGSLDTGAGPVRWLAVPVVLDGETRGVFVVANFIRAEQEEVDESVQVVGLVAGGVALLALLLAFAAAGRVLAPLRLLGDTARSITATDLRRRVRVDSRDEIGELARTFNAMLDRLEAAFSSQRDFLNDASHELRTPITIVRGHLELLGDDPEERRDTVELVTDELDRMSRLVDDMLLLAKAERSDFLRPEVVDLGALSQELLAKSAGLAQRDWQLESSSRGKVVADRQRLTQAVMNLTRNAVEHTEPGCGIAIGSQIVGHEARLWVTDEGPGIDPSEHDRIFERFSRARDGQRSEGAGLGLAITRAIAEAHGGRVEVASAPGRGATFTIIVPTEPPAEAGDE